MNPIIAANLVDLGKNVLLGGIKSLSQNEQSTQTTKTFSSELKNAQSTKHIGDLSKLREKLLNDPEIQKFLADNKNQTVQLDQSADGTFRLLSSNGSQMRINPESHSTQIANDFLTTCVNLDKNLVNQSNSRVFLLG
jgi:Zn-dependent M32 family carboxypeptidase